ncbi:MAG TPA: TetR family transcriptional regulator [Acidimicrobiales bacterium]|jgi:AcrR family transcriptional regulator
MTGRPQECSADVVRLEIAGDEVSTTDGRVPGERGRLTRQRLLDATVDLLSTTSWRSVKVTDIARQAGTSPATFYQYFSNVEEAITVLAEGMVDQAAQLGELVGGDWSEEASWGTALTITEGFLSYWEDNRAVFRVVDLATEDGESQLRGIRVRALNAVTVALAQVISQAAPSHHGTPGTSTVSPAGSDPMAVAGTIVAMFASVSAHRYGFEFWGIRTRHLIDTQARILHWAVTGRPAPASVEEVSPRSGPRTGPVLGGAVVQHRRAERATSPPPG